MDIETQEIVEKKDQTDQEEAVDLSSEINMDTLTVDQIKIGDELDETEQSEESDDIKDSAENSSSEEEKDVSDEDSSTEQSEEGGTSTDAEETTTSLADSSEDTDKVEDIYVKLSEETGVKLNSYEDLVSKLSEVSNAQSITEPTFSKAIQKAIEVEKQGGNLADHFARVSLDLEKMSPKELLRQKFFKDEAKLHGTNPKLAQMKFERAYQEKYGKWESYSALSDPDEKEDFVDDNGGLDNIEYEELMLANDVEEAKSELEAWKEESAPVEVQKPDASGMTEDEQLAIAEAYTKQSKESWDNFEAVNIAMGEGAEDFALGLNEKTKPMVEGWVENPHTFLQDIGFDGKKIDTDRLLPIMTLIAEASEGNLGGKIAKYVIDSDNVKTLKTELGQPSTTGSPSIPQDRDAGDAWEQIGEAAVKARENI